MKNLILSIVSNILIIIIPLLAHPILLIHIKIIILIVGSILIWLTQPTFSIKEAKEKKESDKSSVLLILLMSYTSLLSPIIIWAYFQPEKDIFGLMFYIGLCLMIGGLILRTWAIKKLGEFFTPTVQIQAEHQLITSGPYKIIRHPSYTGAFLTITSFALILHVWLGFLIAVIAMTIAYNVRISIEERELKLYFGYTYEEYSKKTKKLFPFIW